MADLLKAFEVKVKQYGIDITMVFHSMAKEYDLVIVNEVIIKKMSNRLGG